jgi:hypothetical protein
LVGRYTNSTGAGQTITLGSNLTLNTSTGVLSAATGTTSTTVAAGNHTHTGYAATTHTHGYTDIVSVPTDTFLGRDSSGTGAAEAMSVTTARTLLGLGTAAFVDYGTSGPTVPLLDGANTWSGTNLFLALDIQDTDPYIVMADTSSTTLLHDYSARITAANLDQTTAASFGYFSGDLLMHANSAKKFEVQLNGVPKLTVQDAAVTTATKLVTAASHATNGAGLNLPQGAAPSSPANGDVWTTSSGVYARINNATVGPFGTGGGGGSATTTSASPPSSPAAGDRWIDTANGIEFVYISDGNSSQWVQFASAPVKGADGLSGTSGTNGASSSIGLMIAIRTGMFL